MSQFGINKKKKANPPNKNVRQRANVNPSIQLNFKPLIKEFIKNPTFSLPIHQVV